MFGNSIDRMVKSFSGQFEEEGDRLVYRMWGKGSPIPVTAAERDGFIDDYRRGVRKAFWFFMTTLIVVIVGLIAFLVTEDLDFDGSSADVILYALIIGTTGLFVWHTMRLYKMPANRA